MKNSSRAGYIVEISADGQEILKITVLDAEIRITNHKPIDVFNE